MENTLEVAVTNNENKILIRNEKYISKLNDYERYTIGAISDWDTPKIRNCLAYKDLVAPNLCVNDKGVTLLHYAASKQDSRTNQLGGLDMINVILSAGGDPTLKDINGLTAIDYAKIKKFQSTVTILEAFIKKKYGSV